jgi:hypothetical protein
VFDGLSGPSQQTNYSVRPEVSMIKKAPLGYLAVIFSFLIGGTAVAQLPDRPPKPVTVPSPEQGPVCSVVTVQAQPPGTVRDGQKIFFTANYQVADPKATLTIIWNASAGSIAQGQGTNRIEVDSTGAGSTTDREIKAEIWIGGMAPDCVMQASATVKIIAPATKYGEFGEVNAETLSKNLKTLAEFMTQSPDNLYVIAYAGRNSERGFTQSWVKKIKDGLSAAGVAESKVYAMDGGFREQPVFDFWIVPNGAEPPRPSPTIKRNEIVYPKPAPAKKP